MFNKIKSLVENALGRRFSTGERWDEPDYLAGQFSREELNDGLASISKTRRKSGGVTKKATVWIDSDYEQARELIEGAKERKPRFRKLSDEEAEKREAGRIIEQKSGTTPKSFYEELKWEEREREKGKGDKGNLPGF